MIKSILAYNYCKTYKYIVENAELSSLREQKVIFKSNLIESEDWRVIDLNLFFYLSEKDTILTYNIVIIYDIGRFGR